MPRNRNKTPCQVPGCRSWAMRGHTHCRSHRDRELGPRGGGAPLGNLNALKVGDYAHPLPASDLRAIADLLVRQPDQLPDHLDRIARSIQDRTRDPYRILVAFRTVLSDLIPYVATGLFINELHALLQRLPPLQRGPVVRAVNTQLRHLDPADALFSLRDLMIELENSTKTSTGTGSHIYVNNDHLDQ